MNSNEIAVEMVMVRERISTTTTKEERLRLFQLFETKNNSCGGGGGGGSIEIYNGLAIKRQQQQVISTIKTRVFQGVKTDYYSL